MTLQHQMLSQLKLPRPERSSLTSFDLQQTASDSTNLELAHDYLMFIYIAMTMSADQLRQAMAYDTPEKPREKQ